MNSPKGQVKLDPAVFTKHSASRNHLLKEPKLDKKKPGRPSSGMRMDHSSTSKHQRPSSTKEKNEASNEPRKKATNQSSSTDLKKKKQAAEDEDSTEYKRLQEKLNYL